MGYTCQILPYLQERAEQFHELKRLMNRIQAIQGSTRGQLLDSMPALRHFPPFRQTFQQMDSAMGELYAFFDRQIQQKLAAKSVGKSIGEGIDDDEEMDNFVEEFLAEMAKARNGEVTNANKEENDSIDKGWKYFT
jgi:hypothetical protein